MFSARELGFASQLALSISGVRQREQRWGGGVVKTSRRPPLPNGSPFSEVTSVLRLVLGSVHVYVVCILTNAATQPILLAALRDHVTGHLAQQIELGSGPIRRIACRPLDDFPGQHDACHCRLEGHRNLDTYRLAPSRKL